MIARNISELTSYMALQKSSKLIFFFFVEDFLNQIKNFLLGLDAVQENLAAST